MTCEDTIQILWDCTFRHRPSRRRDSNCQLLAATPVQLPERTKILLMLTPDRTANILRREIDLCFNLSRLRVCQAYRGYSPSIASRLAVERRSIHVTP